MTSIPVPGIRTLAAALCALAACAGPDSGPGSASQASDVGVSTTAAAVGGLSSAPAPVEVAAVGEYSIDVEHLRDAAQRLVGKDRQVADLSQTERRQVLAALVDMRLVALEAESRGLGDGAAVHAAVADAERAAINDLMYRLEVEEKVDIAPADVREQYALWGSGEVIEPAHILVRSEAAADSILRDLRAGADFGDLARAHSKHSGSSIRGGSMGVLRKYLIPDPLRRHIWDLPAGGLHPEPIRTMMGYHVVKVLRRAHQTMEQQEGAIRGFLGRKRRAVRERDLHLALQEKYGYEWRGDTVADLVRRGPTSPGDSVLARWRGGELTAAEFRARATGPNAASTDTARLHKLIDDLAAEEIIHREGLARGWGAADPVQRQVEQARLRALGEALLASLAETDPSAGDAEAFYGVHRDRYRGPERLTVQEILVEEQGTADSLHALLVGGADMAELARRHSARAETRAAGGLWRDVEKYGATSATVYKKAMAGHGLLAPVPLPSGGYSIIRVVSVEAGEILPYEEVRDVARQDMQTLAMDAAIARLRRRHQDAVRIDREALASAR